MKVLIDIPNENFGVDITDKFQDFFERLRTEIKSHLISDTNMVCGAHELKTIEMFLKAFKEIQIIPDSATNGDMIKAMFPNIEADEIKTDTGGYIEVKYLDTTDKCDATAFRKD